LVRFPVPWPVPPPEVPLSRNKLKSGPFPFI
jgi:hypothetical protein